MRITTTPNDHGEELTGPMRQVSAVLEASGVLVLACGRLLVLAVLSLFTFDTSS